MHMRSKEWCDQNMTTESEKVSLVELKDFAHGTAEVGEQVDQCTKTTKAIGDAIGKTFGHEMKKLVPHEEESEPVEPSHPTNEKDAKAIAIWNKECDQWLKLKQKCKEQKAKVFAVILGQCDKSMQNRAESDVRFENAEKDCNVIGLLKIVKNAAFDANEKKCPPRQAAWVLRCLMLARQGEEEELVDCCKRFMSIAEMAETTCGKIEPVKMAEQDPKRKANKSKIIEQEKNKMLAFLFVDGANRQQCGFLMRDLGEDHALGSNQHPETVEDALQVLSLYGQKRKSKKPGEDKVETSFAQSEKRKSKMKCWNCGEIGHGVKDCPKRAANTESEQETSQANVQVPHWAGGAGHWTQCTARILHWNNASKVNDEILCEGRCTH